MLESYNEWENKNYPTKYVGFGKPQEIKKIPDSVKNLIKGLKNLFK